MLKTVGRPPQADVKVPAEASLGTIFPNVLSASTRRLFCLKEKSNADTQERTGNREGSGKGTEKSERGAGGFPRYASRSAGGTSSCAPCPINRAQGGQKFPPQTGDRCGWSDFYPWRSLRRSDRSRIWV